MRIGIDISQTQYEGTGVEQYLSGLVKGLLEHDHKNEYTLFFSSLRRTQNLILKTQNNNSKLKIKTFKIPSTILNFLWNRLHIVPIEWLIGDIDIFISSDWTQPPTKRAKKATIIYDFIVFKYPEETHNLTEFHGKNAQIAANIVETQKRRLYWVKKECDAVFCISEATKKDAMEVLGIEEKRLRVIYPGIIVHTTNYE